MLLPIHCHFNSIKVRLKLALPLAILLVVSYFNSIKVRLKQNVKICTYTSRRFQFHKGTIKTVALHGQRQQYSNFNSIKVRLKQPQLIRNLSTKLFQFHKGTIKTATLLAQAKLVCGFQFHKGTIKTCYPPLIRFPSVISIP